MSGLTSMSRRTLLALGGLCVVCAACGSGDFGAAMEVEAGSPASEGHLLSRPPKEPPPVPTATGAQPIGLDGGRDGVIYLPPGLTGPAPLLVLLHGATGSAAGITRRTEAFALADELKMVILAPDSRERTWDAIRGQFGPDVAFLDKALAKVFETVPIDRKRVAVGGFSDGASYAISLGLQNGDLFTARRRVLARLLRRQPAPRPAALLHLARQAGRDPAVRHDQPPHRAGARGRQLQRPLQGVRRPAHGARPDRPRSLRVDRGEEEVTLSQPARITISRPRLALRATRQLEIALLQFFHQVVRRADRHRHDRQRRVLAARRTGSRRRPSRTGS